MISLAQTHTRMPHLDLEQLLSFHFALDSLEIDGAYYDIFDAIKLEVLYKFEQLSLARFSFDEQMDRDIKIALMRLARSHRKPSSLQACLPNARANRALSYLISSGYLFLENSLEKKPKPKSKHQKLPRHQRNKRIEHKLHFKDGFSRFWFSFIEPNLALLKNKQFELVLERIRLGFDHFCSLGFERLCAELLLKELDIAAVQSLWVDRVEIDMFGITSRGVVVAEAKYKEHKMCKNILSELERKCALLGFRPSLMALFSKSGFSKELLRLKGPELLLFELKDFSRLLNE